MFMLFSRGVSLVLLQQAKRAQQDGALSIWESL